jgi:hypothetical protein
MLNSLAQRGCFLFGFRAPIEGMIFKPLVDHHAELPVGFLVLCTD